MCRLAQSIGWLRNPSAEILVRNANLFKNTLAPASAKCEIYGETPEPWSARIAKSCEKDWLGLPAKKRNAKCLSVAESIYIYIYIYISEVARVTPAGCPDCGLSFSVKKKILISRARCPVAGATMLCLRL